MLRASQQLQVPRPFAMLWRSEQRSLRATQFFSWYIGHDVPLRFPRWPFPQLDPQSIGSVNRHSLTSAFAGWKPDGPLALTHDSEVSAAEHGVIHPQASQHASPWSGKPHHEVRVFGSRGDCRLGERRSSTARRGNTYRRSGLCGYDAAAEHLVGNRVRLSRRDFGRQLGLLDRNENSAFDC